MSEDGLGDWRKQLATRILKDVPSTSPGVTEFKAGSPVHKITVVKRKIGGSRGFVTPSPVALSLSIAYRAGKDAESLRGTFRFEAVHGLHTPGQSVIDDDIPRLYDFFEHCMVSASFSFQAIECYCNEIIELKVQTTYPLQRRDEIDHVPSDKLQRDASTEEKIATILPRLFAVDSPKGKKVWQDFIELKRLRDSIVHLKTKDSYNRNRPSDETLFSRFLDTEISRLPRLACNAIDYFASSERPRWLELTRKLLFEGDGSN